MGGGGGGGSELSFWTGPSCPVLPGFTYLPGHREGKGRVHLPTWSQGGKGDGSPTCLVGGGVVTYLANWGHQLK